MKKIIIKLLQSILIAIVTIVIWGIEVMKTGIYEDLFLKRLILMIGVGLIGWIWVTGWTKNKNSDLLK